jgi:hypothetical protein
MLTMFPGGRRLDDRVSKRYSDQVCDAHLAAATDGVDVDGIIAPKRDQVFNDLVSIHIRDARLG